MFPIVEKTAGIERVHPFKRGRLDGFQAAPGSAPTDDLGLEEAGHALRERTIVAVSDAAPEGSILALASARCSGSRQIGRIHMLGGFNRSSQHAPVQHPGRIAGTAPALQRALSIQGAFDPEARMLRRFPALVHVSEPRNRSGSVVIASRTASAPYPARVGPFFSRRSWPWPAHGAGATAKRVVRFARGRSPSCPARGSDPPASGRGPSDQLPPPGARFS